MYINNYLSLQKEVFLPIKKSLAIRNFTMIWTFILRFGENQGPYSSR
jgi:hypothetical protein